MTNGEVAENKGKGEPMADNGVYVQQPNDPVLSRMLAMIELNRLAIAALTDSFLDVLKGMSAILAPIGPSYANQSPANSIVRDDEK